MDSYIFKGMGQDSDDDYLDWSDDEDIICSSKYVISSDEEDDAILFTKPRKSAKKTSKEENADSEDDFEKDMASELSATMSCLTSSFNKKKSAEAKPGTSQGGSEKTKDEEQTEEKEFYDDVYFDSDDSEGEDISAAEQISPKSKEKRRILSNDELFYDPNMDDRDQQWMDAKRRSYQMKRKRQSNGSGASAPQPLPQSDAVLNCPACLTTLCMDCQRHSIYNNQYRAMFVFNCTVDRSEGLKFPTKGQKKKEFLRNKKKNKNLQEQDNSVNSEAPKEEAVENMETCNQEKSSLQHTGSTDTQESSSKSGNNDPSSDTTSTPKEPENNAAKDEASSSGSKAKKVSFACDGGEEIFHPVMCSICNTKVAVFDNDEVYHFFNVVTSY